MLNSHRRIKALLFALLFVFAQPTQAADPVYTGFFSNTAIKGYDAVAYHTE